MPHVNSIDVRTDRISYVYRMELDATIRYWRTVANSAITIDVAFDGQVRGVEINWEKLQEYIDYKQSEYLERKAAQNGAGK